MIFPLIFPWYEFDHLDCLENHKCKAVVKVDAHSQNMSDL